VAAFTRDDLDRYRMKLKTLFDRLSGTAAGLESEVGLPTGPEAMTTQGLAGEPIESSTEGEEEVAQTALLSEEQLLAETRAALARLDDGTFGRCQGCGRGIGKVRLDAVPYARQCIHCARAEKPGLS
jgi:RNA polymerase-binding transcription factor